MSQPIYAVTWFMPESGGEAYIVDFDADDEGFGERDSHRTGDVHRGSGGETSSSTPTAHRYRAGTSTPPPNA